MNKWKVLITWPYLLLTLRSAKRMTKKILRDPNLVAESKRYYWLQKRCHYFAWLYNVKVHVLGEDNWIQHKGCIMIANHQSNFDALLLFLRNDFSKYAPMAFIAKKELLKHRIFKHFVQLIDVLFLDRSNPRQAIKVFDEAKKLIRVPRTLVIFPEGTRSHSEVIGEFKPAALRIAYQTYVPIIPVAIVNSHLIFNKTIKGRKDIYLVFHKSLEPINFINISHEKLAIHLQNILQKTINSFASQEEK